MGETTYEGACFCGAVKLRVTGSPEAAGFCHCRSCRSWAAAPVNAFTLWKPSSVEVVQGDERIGTFAMTERSNRQFCQSCGGHLMTAHPLWDLVDVYAATIPEFPFEPGVHVHYAERVMSMRDGLPKMKDLPAEMGGSGEAIPE